MLSSLLAAGGFVSPRVDYHALAPEMVLGAGICLVLMVDLFVAESKKHLAPFILKTVAIFAELEVCLRQPCNRIALHVGDARIHLNQIDPGRELPRPARARRGSRHGHNC